MSDKIDQSPERTANVVVVGSINMDLVVTTEKAPIPGETILGNQFAMIPGGKGANQAVAAARLGASVRMVSCVGDDLFGAQMIAQLQREGVDTAHVRTVSHKATGVALIQVQHDGDNSIIVVPGANGEVTPEQVESAEEIIRQADVLLVQLEIPLPAVIRAAELARKHGVRTILNPAPAARLPQQLLDLVDIVTPNETEAAILADGHAEAEGNIRDRMRSLKALVPDADVIITNGEKGVLYDIGGKQGTRASYKVEVVDTTAAGDSFNAALAVRLGEGASAEEAVGFAVKVGALTVTRFGAQTSLPTRKEAERFG